MLQHVIAQKVGSMPLLSNQVMNGVPINLKLTTKLVKDVTTNVNLVLMLTVVTIVPITLSELLLQNVNVKTDIGMKKETGSVELVHHNVLPVPLSKLVLFVLELESTHQIVLAQMVTSITDTPVSNVTTNVSPVKTLPLTVLYVPITDLLNQSQNVHVLSVNSNSTESVTFVTTNVPNVSITPNTVFSVLKTECKNQSVIAQKVIITLITNQNVQFVDSDVKLVSELLTTVTNVKKTFTDITFTIVHVKMDISKLINNQCVKNVTTDVLFVTNSTYVIFVLKTEPTITP
jgi:hypothetical protein